MIEIAGLKAKVGTLEKWTGGLTLVFLGALAWIFYNIYQPMKDLQKDSAVQTTILQEIRDDIHTLTDKLDKKDEPETGSRPK